MPANKDLSKINEINQRLEALFPGLMGVRVTELDPDRVVAEMVVRPDLCSAGGILHGGATMAFADTIGAVATFINLPPGTRTVTVESKTNFIGAAPLGSLVSAECTPFHRGKSTMVWQTVVRNATGKTLAVVSQTQLVLPV